VSEVQDAADRSAAADVPRLTEQLYEFTTQQLATAEILRVISSSP
jgi:hypothetical protein